MAWHALTFDGLDAALADAEFADQAEADLTVGPAKGGVTTTVAEPAVRKFMLAIDPYLRQAIANGVNDGLGKQKQKIVIGTVAASGVAVLALAFLWRISARLHECCPARPVSGCCPSS